MKNEPVKCPHCADQHNIKYGKQLNRRQRYFCISCKRTFNERTGTPLARLRTPVKDVIEAIHMFATGSTEADISRIKKVTEKTVHRWIRKTTIHCIRFNNHFLEGIKAFFIQLDELYAFIKKKSRKQWVWTCIEAFSRLLVCFAIGKRKRATAERILDLTKSRLSMNPSIITSDGLERYTELVPETFPTSLYAQVIKRYENKRLVDIELRPINGTLDKIIQIIKSMNMGNTVNTAYVERLNLTIRNSVNSLARRTWCVVKKYLGLVAKMHIFQAFYNFARKHMNLKGRTPAMTAGLTDHAWTWYELLAYRI